MENLSLTIAKNQTEQGTALNLLHVITLKLQGKRYAPQIYAAGRTVYKR